MSQISKVFDKPVGFPLLLLKPKSSWW